jgi:hypothetical protein
MWIFFFAGLFEVSGYVVKLLLLNYVQDNLFLLTTY